MVRIKKWEIWGAILSVVVGTLFHFIFEWSGKNPVVAIFGAVNESTWEHLKMAFWPTFIFASLEYLSWGAGKKNFCFASFVKLFSMPIIILVLHYGWTAKLPGNVVFDITSFYFAVLFGYYLSYKILKSEKSFGSNSIWAILITVGLLKFSLFTYFPPKLFFFEDPDGNYGIPEEVVILSDPNGCLNFNINACPTDLCDKNCEPSINSNTSNCQIGKCVPKK